MLLSSLGFNSRMEVKEVDRVVIAKPVATRPSCSSFRSFTELLAGAINSSPSPNVCRETTVPAIRPKTVRVKPTVNRAPVGLLSFQGEASGTTPHSSSDKVSKPDPRSSVVYKPLAKVVSKTTVSLLASMASPSVTHQHTLAQVEAHAQHLNQDKLQLPSQEILNLPHPPSSIVSPEVGQKSVEPSRRVVEEVKHFTSPANADRPSYDGYNWRKYGQKQVKGSEYPRSYYKCTYPNCPVKKKVERSFDGQIAEIVYKGEHNHPKPQPPKRNSSGVQRQGSEGNGIGLGQDTHNNAKWSDNLSERNEGFEGHVENHGEVGLSAQLNYLNKSWLLSIESGASGMNNVAGGATPENSCGISGDCEEGSRDLEHEDEPKSKRRKNEDRKNEAGTSGEAVQQPHVLVQNNAEPEIQGDGFHWRKYGKSISKKQLQYKCTSIKCNMKYVERASDDLRAFITTYEGKHNHEMPLKSTNSAALQQDPRLFSLKDTI